MVQLTGNHQYKKWLFYQLNVFLVVILGQGIIKVKINVQVQLTRFPLGILASSLGNITTNVLCANCRCGLLVVLYEAWDQENINVKILCMCS